MSKVLKILVIVRILVQSYLEIRFEVVSYYLEVLGNWVLFLNIFLLFLKLQIVEELVDEFKICIFLFFVL